MAAQEQASANPAAAAQRVNFSSSLCNNMRTIQVGKQGIALRSRYCAAARGVARQWALSRNGNAADRIAALRWLQYLLGRRS
jgi:hypothetical protein